MSTEKAAPKRPRGKSAPIVVNGTVALLAEQIAPLVEAEAAARGVDVSQVVNDRLSRDYRSNLRVSGGVARKPSTKPMPTAADYGKPPT